MADMLSVRADDELQARFRNFAEAGDFRSHSVFLDHLLTLHAAQQTGLKVPTLEGAVNAVNDLTDRVNKILIGIGETIILNQNKIKDQMEAERKEADDKISALITENEDKINTCVSENERLKNETAEYQLKLESTIKELRGSNDRAMNLEKALDDKSALIEEYRKKNERLEIENKQQNELMSDAVEAMAELETLRFTVKEQSLKIEQSEITKEKALAELENALRAEMNNQQAQHASVVSDYEKKLLELERALRSEMSNQQAQHAAIENNYEKKLLEKDKALIELEKSLRSEMSNQQAAYAASVTKYENRIMSFLSERQHYRIDNKQADE